jgi:hypothetical protein
VSTEIHAMFIGARRYVCASRARSSSASQRTAFHEYCASSRHSRVKFALSRSGRVLASTDEAQENASKQELVVKPRPASRHPGQPPKPVQIERTSSFLIRKSEEERREKYSSSGTDLSETAINCNVHSNESNLEFEKNPVEWVLKKTDQSLDAMENTIPDDARNVITYVTGNLGTNASKVAIDAAKLAAKGGVELAKVAVPAGTWVVSKGFRALISVANGAAAGDKKKKER